VRLLITSQSPSRAIVHCVTPSLNPYFCRLLCTCTENRYERGRWKRGPGDPPLPPSDFVAPPSEAERLEKLKAEEKDRKREAKAREKAARAQAAQSVAPPQQQQQHYQAPPQQQSASSGLDDLFGAPSSAPVGGAAASHDPFGGAMGGGGAPAAAQVRAPLLSMCTRTYHTTHHASSQHSQTLFICCDSNGASHIRLLCFCLDHALLITTPSLQPHPD
jgi:hypothetical protein